MLLSHPQSELLLKKLPHPPPQLPQRKSKMIIHMMELHPHPLPDNVEPHPHPQSVAVKSLIVLPPIIFIYGLSYDPCLYVFLHKQKFVKKI